MVRDGSGLFVKSRKIKCRVLLKSTIPRMMVPSDLSTLSKSCKSKSPYVKMSYNIVIFIGERIEEKMITYEYTSLGGTDYIISIQGELIVRVLSGGKRLDTIPFPIILKRKYSLNEYSVTYRNEQGDICLAPLRGKLDKATLSGILMELENGTFPNSGGVMRLIMRWRTI